MSPVKSNKSWKTFFKANHWAGSARDSVDAPIVTLAGKLSMKGARQQGVGDISHHLLRAAFRWQFLGLHHSSGEEKQDSSKLRHIVEKHVLVLQCFRLLGRLCFCRGFYGKRRQVTGGLFVWSIEIIKTTPTRAVRFIWRDLSNRKQVPWWPFLKDRSRYDNPYPCTKCYLKTRKGCSRDSRLPCYVFFLLVY